MTPRHQHADQVLGDFSFGKEHFENSMLEDGLEILEFKGRCYPEGALTAKTTIGTENVAVGVRPQEISKRLYGDGSARHCIVFWHSLLKKQKAFYVKENRVY
jgi:hypothetical protein